MDLTRAEQIAHETYERWRLTSNRDAYIAAVVREAAKDAYQAGWEDAADAVEAVLSDGRVTYSLNNANDPDVRAGRKTIEVLTPMMTETEAIRAALHPESV